MKDNQDRCLCSLCHVNRALFRIHGHWRRDRDHDLCPRCFRSLRDRLRAQLLAGRVAPTGHLKRAA